MKTRTKLLTAGGLTLVLAAVAVTGASQAYSGKGDWRHGGKHGRHFETMIELFDTNGDGSLTQAEIDQGRAEQMATYDVDGDQQLSLEEYEALWVAVMRPRLVDRFQHLDADGDAMVTVVEFTEPTTQLVARRDRDGDGLLSRDDMKRRHHGERHDGERDDD